MILCDSNIIIDLLNGKDKAKKLILQYPPKDVLISSISEWEILIGARDKNELNLYQKSIKRFPILVIDKDTSSLAGILIKRYNLSHNLLIPDALIAATSMRWKLPLVTQNKKDFNFIPGIKLLESY